MKVHVYYPSGITFTLDGEWIGPVGGGDDPQGVLLRAEDHTVKVLDPRAVIIKAESKEIVYQPRSLDVFPGLDTEWKEWLRDHQDWPQRLQGRLGIVLQCVVDVVPPEMQSDGASLRRGDLVEKTASEPGDAHPDGARGTILGSMGDNDTGMAYFVGWDDNPGLPVGIASHRIRKVT